MIECAQLVSGKSFIKYAQSQKIAKPNNLKFLAVRSHPFYNASK
jgi:hypothetical protein